MLVAHCCDDVVVLIQSLISCVAAFPSPFSLLLPRLVCVVLQGNDALWQARNSPWGGKDKIGEAGARELEVGRTALPLHDGV